MAHLRLEPYHLSRSVWPTLSAVLTDITHTQGSAVLPSCASSAILASHHSVTEGSEALRLGLQNDGSGEARSIVNVTSMEDESDLDSLDDIGEASPEFAAFCAAFTGLGRSHRGGHGPNGSNNAPSSVSLRPPEMALDVRPDKLVLRRVGLSDIDITASLNRVVSSSYRYAQSPDRGGKHMEHLTGLLQTFRRAFFDHDMGRVPILGAVPQGTELETTASNVNSSIASHALSLRAQATTDEASIDVSALSLSDGRRTAALLASFLIDEVSGTAVETTTTATAASHVQGHHHHHRHHDRQQQRAVSLSKVTELFGTLRVSQCIGAVLAKVIPLAAAVAEDDLSTILGASNANVISDPEGKDAGTTEAGVTNVDPVETATTRVCRTMTAASQHRRKLHTAIRTAASGTVSLPIAEAVADLLSTWKFGDSYLTSTSTICPSRSFQCSETLPSGGILASIGCPTQHVRDRKSNSGSGSAAVQSQVISADFIVPHAAVAALVRHQHAQLHSRRQQQQHQSPENNAHSQQNDDEFPLSADVLFVSSLFGARGVDQAGALDCTGMLLVHDDEAPDPSLPPAPDHQEHHPSLQDLRAMHSAESKRVLSERRSETLASVFKPKCSKKRRSIIYDDLAVDPDTDSNTDDDSDASHSSHDSSTPDDDDKVSGFGSQRRGRNGGSSGGGGNGWVSASRRKYERQQRRMYGQGTLGKASTDRGQYFYTSSHKHRRGEKHETVRVTSAAEMREYLSKMSEAKGGKKRFQGRIIIDDSEQTQQRNEDHHRHQGQRDEEESRTMAPQKKSSLTHDSDSDDVSSSSETSDQTTSSDVSSHQCDDKSPCPTKSTSRSQNAPTRVQGSMFGGGDDDSTSSSSSSESSDDDESRHRSKQPSTAANERNDDQQRRRGGNSMLGNGVTMGRVQRSADAEDDASKWRSMQQEQAQDPLKLLTAVKKLWSFKRTTQSTIENAQRQQRQRQREEFERRHRTGVQDEDTKEETRTTEETGTKPAESQFLVVVFAQRLTEEAVKLFLQHGIVPLHGVGLRRMRAIIRQANSPSGPGISPAACEVKSHRVAQSEGNEIGEEDAPPLGPKNENEMPTKNAVESRSVSDIAIESELLPTTDRLSLAALQRSFDRASSLFLSTDLDALGPGLTAFRIRPEPILRRSAQTSAHSTHPPKISSHSDEVRVSHESPAARKRFVIVTAETQEALTTVAQAVKTAVSTLLLPRFTVVPNNHSLEQMNGSLAVSRAPSLWPGGFSYFLKLADVLMTMAASLYSNPVSSSNAETDGAGSPLSDVSKQNTTAVLGQKAMRECGGAFPTQWRDTAIAAVVSGIANALRRVPLMALRNACGPHLASHRRPNSMTLREITIDRQPSDVGPRSEPQDVLHSDSIRVTKKTSQVTFPEILHHLSQHNERHDETTASVRLHQVLLTKSGPVVTSLVSTIASSAVSATRRDGASTSAPCGATAVASLFNDAVDSSGVQQAAINRALETVAAMLRTEAL